MSMTACYLRVDESVLHKMKEDKLYCRAVIQNWDNIKGEIDLGGIWDVLHFMLSKKRREDAKRCGDPKDSGGYAIHGKHVLLTDIPLPYGPARYIAGKDIEEAANLIGQITIDRVRSILNPEALAKVNVYPGNWESSMWSDDELASIVESLQCHVNWLWEAVSSNDVVVAYIA
jgi:hypothetical protein